MPRKVTGQAGLGRGHGWGTGGPGRMEASEGKPRPRMAGRSGSGPRGGEAAVPADAARDGRDRPRALCGVRRGRNFGGPATQKT